MKHFDKPVTRIMSSGVAFCRLCRKTSDIYISLEVFLSITAMLSSAVEGDYNVNSKTSVNLGMAS